MQARIEDYRRFQIPHIWFVDPSRRIGWDCSDGNWIRKSRFEVSSSPIHLDLDQLLRDLDTAQAQFSRPIPRLGHEGSPNLSPNRFST